MVDNTRPDFLLDNADVLFAVIGHVDARVIRDLTFFLESNMKLRVELVACVYPASPTQEGTLAELLQLRERTEARLEVSVLPIPLDHQAFAITTAACVNNDSGQCRVWFENASTLGASSTIPGHFGMHVDAGEAALRRWLACFVALRDAAAPLTGMTALVPHLVPARGTMEAAEAWQCYLESCRELGGSGSASSSENGDLPAEGQEEKTAAAVESICREVGIEPPDQLAQVIASILSKGHVVTIDKSSRTPPLELSIKAEWLGVESLRSIGLLSRETKYRLRRQNA